MEINVWHINNNSIFNVSSLVEKHTDMHLIRALQTKDIVFIFLENKELM